MSRCRAHRWQGGRARRPRKLSPVCREGVRTSTVVWEKGEGRGGGRWTGKVKSKIIEVVAVSVWDTPLPPLQITTSRTGCVRRALRRLGCRTVRQGRPVKHWSDVRQIQAGGQSRFTVVEGVRRKNSEKIHRGAMRRRECMRGQGRMEGLGGLLDGGVGGIFHQGQRVGAAVAEWRRRQSLRQG